MNHQLLIAHVALRLGVTKISVENVLTELADAVHLSLSKGDAVMISRIGIFLPKKRAARWAMNPRTRLPIWVRAKKTPAFKASDALKAALK